MVYYKFNGLEFQQFPIDVWVDICDVVTNRFKPQYFYVLWFKDLFQYSNLIHPCPHLANETLYLKIDKFPVDFFDSRVPQLLPAGKYRVEFSFSNGTHENVMATLKIFGSVSDYRVEIF